MKNIILLIISIFIIVSCAKKNSKQSQIAHKIIDNFSVKMKKEHYLNLQGKGLGFSKGMNLFLVRYKIHKKINLEQARNLIVNCSQTLLAMINSNIELRPFLSNYPYNNNNLDIIITFYDELDERAAFPNLAFISVGEGKIYYDFYDTLKQDFVPSHRESYEEALKIVRDKGNLN